MSTTPDESTLSPDQVRRVLAESRRSARSTDTLVQRAAAVFTTSRELGERNGFVDGVKALIRGNAA